MDPASSAFLKRSRHQTSKEELQKYSREELEVRVQQLETHVFQLKNVIAKSETSSLLNPNRQDLNHKPFDFSRSRKRHVFIRIMYLGWDFHGYTLQEDSVHTIESYLFSALIKACLIPSKAESNYHRCGRTDKGVSAFSQVISIDIRSRLTPENEDDVDAELPYCTILNRLLPTEIRAIAWSPAPEPNSSARFDCAQRTYHYIFPRGDMDINSMNEAAQKLVGTHDFRNLCKMDVGNGVVEFVRSIKSAQVKVIRSDSTNHEVPLEQENLATGGENHSNMKPVSQLCGNPYDMCELVITSKAFLWHQIRCITSVLFLIGKGRESTSIIDELLDISKCPEKPQYKLASELPLNLFECTYDIPLKWHYDPENITKVTKELQMNWTNFMIKGEMIREMIKKLESEMSSVVISQADGLVLSLSKEYQPIMERQKCSSLEKQIDNFAKRRKMRYAPSKSGDSDAIVGAAGDVTATTETA